MLKELENYLRSDWWTIGDACQIISGFVPSSDGDGIITPPKSISISDGTVCSSGRVEHLAAQVREKWESCFHWYEEPGSTKFVRTGLVDPWEWQVSKTYAILWAIDQEFEVWSWVSEAIELGLLAEIP